ncbi:hypothetical protein [Streptomyces flavofungini]|uniref:hypothetical protein n=1 Tax=Streptomyces flavofungini TaxID=68200 RepID=UPI0025B1EE60|nr:hypothetical protein [Streptomyces flavofungini]WJV46476.1 hypothetical protein QUY26_13590 [Streptomyces flavofungini]
MPPGAAAHLRAAEYTAQNTDRDDPAWRAAMDENRALHTAARKSLTHEQLALGVRHGLVSTPTG